MEDRASDDAERAPSRWLVAIMGTLLQVCLGSVYAWSFFQKPLMADFGWNTSQVMWIFSLAICFLGLAAAWGGMNLPRVGPTQLAVVGGLLYGGGLVVSALAMRQHSLPLFYAAFGVVGGSGLGLGYVAPVATVAKWFPDKKGLVTGMVVMGFGLGALVMSKLVAPALMAATGNDLPKVFLRLGIAIAVLAPSAGAFLRNPPENFSPPGFSLPRVGGSRAPARDDLTAVDCLLSWRFVTLWLFFFCNICAGIMFIGLQSPMLQDLLKTRAPYATLPPGQAKAALAAAGATLIAGSALCNGLGRLFWGGLSDKLGRVVTFRIILGTQVLAFVALMFVETPAPFCVLVGYVLLCYGGGFGTAPATVLSAFGARLMPTVYGILLTAWSTAGIVGPQVAAIIKDRFPVAAPLYTYAAAASILAFGFILSCMVGDQPFTKSERAA